MQRACHVLTEGRITQREVQRGPTRSKTQQNTTKQQYQKYLRDISFWFVFRAGLEKLRAICVEALLKTQSPSTSSQFALNCAKW